LNLEKGKKPAKANVLAKYSRRLLLDEVLVRVFYAFCSDDANRKLNTS
jgi:hypothetical protein